MWPIQLLAGNNDLRLVIYVLRWQPAEVEVQHDCGEESLHMTTNESVCRSTRQFCLQKDG